MAVIIKAGQQLNQGDELRSAAFNFEDIAAKADGYLGTVREQAEAILAEARQQADVLRKNAHQEGRQDAVREATQAAGKKLDQQLQMLMPALEQAVESLQRAEQSWKRHWEQRTVHLAVEIAARVIRRELREVPEITLALVQEALQLAMGSPRIKLHLHPADHQALGDQVQTLLSHLGELGPTEVTSNADISPGGCRVTTEFGTIDQTLEAQLARIEEELT